MVDGMAERQSQLSPEEQRARLARLLRNKAAKPRVAPVSFSQERQWFLEQLEPGNVAFNIPYSIRLTGQLNIPALKSSLNAIIRRHETLRTTFAIMDGRPVQVIAPFLILSLPMADLSGLAAAAREAEARRLTVEEAQRPFDLTHGPLFRACLLRLGEAEHMLLLAMHHIVSDAWSLGVLLREVSMLYRAFSRGEPSPLPALPIQYADFAVWQREWLKGSTLKEQLTYWQQQLQGAPTILDLPTDRPRPSIQSSRGARQHFALSDSLSQALKALSQAEQVTLFITLLTAWKVLLYRYTGQTDILVGTPIANRRRSELEGLIGFFVNFLVLRADLADVLSFRELLVQVREAALGAYAHQDVPFEMLVEQLQPERNLSRTPLYQVMFALQNTPMESLGLPGLVSNPLPIDSETAKLDLFLAMWETPHGLAGWLEYNTDIFDAASAERMIGHWETLLRDIVANPERRIADFAILTEAEQHQLLVTWNDTRTPHEQDACIHELFEAQVARTPDAVAVVREVEHLTYGAMNARANRLARYLQTLGVCPETPVGVYLERSPDMVIGLLGVLKAGGAYLPLDPTYPTERLAFMLEDAQVSLVLTRERLVEALGPEARTYLGSGRRAIYLDKDWPKIAQASDENQASGVTANNLAYVIYTSGSTGQPKGVCGLHRGAVNRFQWMWATYPFEAEEICCQKTALSFVDSVWEIFGHLLRGLRLVIIPDEVLKDPARLVQTLWIENVNRIVLVPSLLRAILDTHVALHRQLPNLKIWITSGEALPLELAQRFWESMPHSILLNLYGSSEVAADATCYDTRQGRSLSVIPIGQPIANTQVYLLDSHLQLAPVGVPGELYVGGAGLARGYYRRPALTAEKFIPNPFSHEPGSRLYKTGDLACYLPDGRIEFIGRVDRQVKVRGFRIELGEVEAMLSRHPDVREAVVMVREEAAGEKQLVAYVVANQGRSPTLGDLRHFLRGKLPEYMLPSAYVMLEALPLTPNGKVDRRALLAPDHVQSSLEDAFVPARTPLEETLVGIWMQVLERERVGIHDNFFEIGGHSLNATRAIVRVNQALNLNLNVRILFLQPTIEKLAATIEKAREISAADAAVTDRIAEIKKRIEQLSSQRNLEGS